MLGFAAGVMIAASFWSLLAPALEMAADGPLPEWVPAAAGFLLGGAFLWGMDRILPHLHLGMPIEQAEGIRTGWQRSILLVMAITLHNIPEGLAVGVAFGAVAAGLPAASLAGAVALAVGIGLQNFPEGAAVSIPLRREGLTPLRSFWYGQLSGIVEPIAAVRGRGPPRPALAALRPGFRRRSDDLRCGRGADSGITIGKEHRSGHDRCDAGIRPDDGPGRCAGVKSLLTAKRQRTQRACICVVGHIRLHVFTEEDFSYTDSRDSDL
jgi:hypothetical protein